MVRLRDRFIYKPQSASERLWRMGRNISLQAGIMAMVVALASGAEWFAKASSPQAFDGLVYTKTSPDIYESFTLLLAGVLFLFTASWFAKRGHHGR